MYRNSEGSLCFFDTDEEKSLDAIGQKNISVIQKEYNYK